MSDFGLFESDEAAGLEPRVAARTAARRLEAAIDEVRAKFGPFLLGATGIDEFGDRWHYSKADIRKTVEPYVHPATGTMRRIQNAMKADWKLAHPYKLAEGGGATDNIGGGGNGNGVGSVGGSGSGAPQPTTVTPSLVGEGIGGGPINPESGNLISTSPPGPGLYPGSAMDMPLVANRRQALSHDEAGFGSMPEGDHDHRNQNLKKTYHPSDGNLIPSGDFESWKDSVDQGGPEKVDAHNFTPGGDSGAAKKARRRHATDDDNYSSWMSGWADHESDVREREREEAEKDGKKEAAMLVADIYTDFAQANGLRVASLDTLDLYAQTGIHEDDYRLLQSMIVRTAEADCEDEDDEEDTEDSDDDDSDTDSAPPSPPESDESDDSDTEDDEEADDAPEPSESDSDDESDSEGGEAPDFGGDDTGGDVSQTFTVPEHAPELDPQMMGEIPADDTDGSAPVPPEVVDSLLGLPPGTIEQLLLEEVEQGAQGGAPEAGGGDFLGDAGGDNTQPPRMARRRKAIQLGPPLRGEEGARAKALMDRDKENLESIRNGKNPYLHPGYNYDEERWYTPDELRQREAARRFRAAPDESEEELTERQKRDQKDSIDTKYESWTKSKTASQKECDICKHEHGHPGVPAVVDGKTRHGLWAFMCPDHFKSHGIGLGTGRGQHIGARSFWAADDDQSGGGDSGGGQQPPAQDPAAQGMDPAAMGGGIMPPPGSQSIQPPAPAAPLENQPAEDQLLDMASQAITQMIDRETSEFQQIIDPLTQALQAVQFAQQVESAEHPLDVTPPQGTVNVDPSQAPAAQAMQQQAFRRSAGSRYFNDEGEPLMSGSQARFEDYLDADRDPYEAHYGDDFGPDYDDGDDDDEGTVHGQHPNDYHDDKEWMDFRASRTSRRRQAAGDPYAESYGEIDRGGPSIDDPTDGPTYQRVHPDIEKALRRRFDGGGASAWHPDKPNTILHGIGNWWDGPTEVEHLGGGELQYTCPYTKRQDRFNVDGYHTESGEHRPWSSDHYSSRRQAKISRIIKDAAYVIARRYNISEHGYRQIVAAALGRRDYEHLLEAVRLAHPSDRKDVGDHVAHLLAIGNPRFNKDVWMKAVMASKPRDRAGDAWRDGRDRGDAEHKRQDLNDDPWSDKFYSPEPGGAEGDPNPRREPPSAIDDWDHYYASRGRHPFDRPRLAGETWVHKSINDTFEFENDQPQSRDNMTINDLPKVPGGHVGSSQRAIDRFQRWENYRQQRGLPAMSDDAEIHNFQQTSKPYKSKVGDEAEAKIHRDRNLEPDSPKAPKVKVPKAVNPVLKGKGTKTPAAPKPTVPKTKAAAKQASFFTRKVPGWRWDDHLSGYISKEGRAFTCSCGEKVAAPSYKTCGCGKVWNVYAIGDTHHLASDSAEMFIAREIPVRENVIMANRKMATRHERGADGEWREVSDKHIPDTHSYENQFGEIEHEPKEEKYRKAQKPHQELLAMIDKLADWTKYDDPEDPVAKAYGKSKIPSTKAPKIPRDWSKREPDGKWKNTNFAPKKK